jgi:hypothetical protein
MVKVCIECIPLLFGFGHYQLLNVVGWSNSWDFLNYFFSIWMSESTLKDLHLTLHPTLFSTYHSVLIISLVYIVSLNYLHYTYVKKRVFEVFSGPSSRSVFCLCLTAVQFIFRVSLRYDVFKYSAEENLKLWKLKCRLHCTVSGEPKNSSLNKTAL